MFSPSWLSGKLGGFAMLLPLLNIIFVKQYFVGWVIFLGAAVLSYFIGGWLIVLTGCDSNKKSGLWFCAVLNIIAVII